MSKAYFVFSDNSYDALDFFGEFTEDELKRLLNQTGYDRVSIHDLIVIEGKAVQENELKKIKEA